MMAEQSTSLCGILNISPFNLYEECPPNIFLKLNDFVPTILGKVSFVLF